MIQPVSTVAIFCEDVRDEASGQTTIIGTLPDNVIARGAPPVTGESRPRLPKLGLYLRLNIDTRAKPTALSAKVVDAEGETIATTDWQQSVIDAAFQSARSNKAPLVGFIFRCSMGPFPVVANGLVKAIVTVDGTEFLAGALNIQVNPDAAVSAQPALQYPSDAPASS
jgi:hypothetical protein